MHSSYLLENLVNTCRASFFLRSWVIITLTANPLLDLCVTYVTPVRNLCVQSSDLPHLQVVLMSCVRFFQFLCAMFFLTLSQLHPSSHSTSASLLLSFYPFSHCTMLYCPNPSCTWNLRNAKKPFPSDKSFANHVQQSPECKPFVFDQTAVSAFTMQAPSKSASTHTTAHLFKKQRLRLNPTYAQQQPTNTTNTHRLEDQLMDDDDVSLSNDNAAHQSGSLRDDNSVASEESFGFEESYGYNDFC